MKNPASLSNDAQTASLNEQAGLGDDLGRGATNETVCNKNAQKLDSWIPDNVLFELIQLLEDGEDFVYSSKNGSMRYIRADKAPDVVRLEDLEQECIDAIQRSNSSLDIVIKAFVSQILKHLSARYPNGIVIKGE